MIRNDLARCSEYQFGTIIDKTFFLAKSAPRFITKQLISNYEMPELWVFGKHPNVSKKLYAHCLHYFEQNQSQDTQVILSPIARITLVEHAFKHFYTPAQKPLELRANNIKFILVIIEAAP